MMIPNNFTGVDLALPILRPINSPALDDQIDFQYHALTD